MTEQEMNEAIRSMAYMLNANDEFLRQAIKSHGLIICSAEPVTWIFRNRFGIPEFSSNPAVPPNSFPVYAPPTRETT